MAVAPSFQDLLDQGKAEAVARRPDLTYAEGDVTLADLHAAAAMSDAAINYAAQRFRETFIDGARGDALTALVDDHFNIQRKAATAASVTVSFARAIAGVGGTIPTGTQVASAASADGAQVVFTTNAPIVVGNGTTGPYTVLATCAAAGTAGNVKAGTVTKILDALFDTFTVSNASSAGGGNEGETDEELRQRARNFYQTLHRGTAAALEFGAMLVPNVRVARVIEDEESLVTLVAVSDSNGTSSIQMVNDVQAELENWRAAGAAVQVVGGKRAQVDMTIVIAKAAAGFDALAAASGIADAVETYINKLSVGETMYLDGLVAAVISYSPDEIRDVAFSTILVDSIAKPTNLDVVPGSNTLLRPGTITVVAG